MIDPMPEDLRAEWDDADAADLESNVVELPRFRTVGDEQDEKTKPTQPRPFTVADVIAQWRAEGPLVHEATGFAELDKRTGGGPVYGTRWYILGAPDAGKTAVLASLAHAWATRGIVVGFHAVDEEAGDVVTRLAQRAGYQRRDCEERDPILLDDFERHIGVGNALFIYDASWTIEAATADLATRASGRRLAYFGDSIQTLECDAERGGDDARPKSIRESVSARVIALRSAAKRHGLIAIASSEMNRAAYRTVNAADEVNDLASAKESGAIEYSGRVLLVLRNMPADVAENVIECRVAKNKHGPTGATPIYFAIDRARMSLEETDAPDLPDKDDAAADRLDAKLERNAPALVKIVLGEPGIGTTQLHTQARLAKLGGRDAIATLIQYAIETGLIVDRPTQRGTVTDHHFFVPSAADQAVAEAS